MKEVSVIYLAAANELIGLAVPASLSQNHLEIVNNYLETAVATQNISNFESDPFAAYTALNTYAKNTSEEASLLLNIQIAAASSGIFSNDI